MDGNAPRKRDYLAISTVSLLGSCETRFYDAMFPVKPPVVTRAMQVGKVQHEKLTEKLPKMTKEEIIKTINSGARCAFREVSVLDKKLKTIGRMDEIRFHDGFVGAKRQGILIDDKFTKIAYNGIPLYYKLQLASYVCAMDNSEDFSGICTINKAVLICREAKTRDIMKELVAESDEVDAWRANVPEAVSVAWNLYNKDKAAEHRRFDVERGVWVGCYCDVTITAGRGEE